MADKKFSAWNPGIESKIPARLLPRISLFTGGGYDEALEAATLTGLPIERMADPGVRRMVVHELLLRVTADLTVPDGPNYEDLGIALRGMVDVIFEKHMKPELPRIEKEYDELRDKALARMGEVLRRGEKKSFLEKIFGGKKTAAAATATAEDKDIALIENWRRTAAETGDGFDAAVLNALADTASALMGRHGRLSGDKELIARLALRLFSADYGVLALRRMVAPHFLRAVEAEGFRLLPYQSRPIIMNVKGASAAGKSTVRPRQRELAAKLGIAWEDFALISPDYWRKYLIDYDALAGDYKYAGMLTGHELAAVDAKLDRYMEYKGREARLPHMLIDRFRFDSFTVDGQGEYTSRLLTRFGDRVFLFFVITHPVNTVERAWQRGLATGRYKAVDDLLAHNAEAFAGMAGLFFSWTAIRDKTIHYEFLDNDVPENTRPRTVAFGKGNQMVVLDADALGNIDRFRAVNINAKTPGEVLDDDAAIDYAFLRECVAKIPRIVFADGRGKITGRMEKGKWLFGQKDFAGDAGIVDALGWSDDIKSGTDTGSVAGDYTIGEWGK